MKAAFRTRFWLEFSLSLACGLAAVATLLWRDWIEAITRFDPDHHNGSSEWLIVAGLALAAVLAGRAARREWRRSRAVPVTAS